MTLRLVSDNDEPIDLTTVPTLLRQIASDIEKGAYGDIEMAVLLLESGDVLNIGDDGASAIEMMGLFEAAKLQAFADMMTGDD